MRKIDWENSLSPEDIEWLRQTGIPGVEDRITKHQAQFDAEVPEVESGPDRVTRSVLDSQAGADSFVKNDNVPRRVEPTEADPQDEDDEGDDYDRWQKSELEDEVVARNNLAAKSDGGITVVEVSGTGKDGAVLKADLIKGLRLWDSENPDALKD